MSQQGWAPDSPASINWRQDGGSTTNTRGTCSSKQQRPATSDVITVRASVAGITWTFECSRQWWMKQLRSAPVHLVSISSASHYFTLDSTKQWCISKGPTGDIEFYLLRTVPTSNATSIGSSRAASIKSTGPGALKLPSPKELARVFDDGDDSEFASSKKSRRQKRT